MMTVNKIAILRSPIKDLVYYLDGQSNIGRAGIGGSATYIVPSVPIARSTIWNRATGVWDDLAYLVNGGVPSITTTGNEDFGIAHELAYRESVKFPGKNIRILLGAYGGAGMGYITGTPTAGFWRPDLTILAYPQHYNMWIAARTAALATLTSYVEMGRLFYQGEADSPDDLLGGKQYELNQKALLEQTAIDTHRFKTLVYGLNENMQVPQSNYAASVNAANQNNVSNGFSDLYKVTTGTPLKSDQIHNNLPGTIALAQWGSDNLAT
jgi:hypothetical protein